MRAVIGQLEFIITAIKHTAYVTRVLYGGNNARCLRHKFQRAQFLKHFIKEIKNLSSCIVELYKHLGIFKNTREVREALGCASCFSMYFSRVLKNFRVLIYITQQCTRGRFLFL